MLRKARSLFHPYVAYKKEQSESMTHVCMEQKTRESETKSRCCQPTNKLMNNIEAYVISYLIFGPDYIVFNIRIMI